MTDYIYTMSFEPNKFAEQLEAYLGTEVTVGASGNRSLSFKIKDTDITQAQQEVIIDNLPEFVRMFYTFKRKAVPSEEPV